MVTRKLRRGNNRWRIIVKGDLVIMKFKQHIKVGKYILEHLGNDKLEESNINGIKINRIAYLFGNVAPDLNCVYPAHRLKTTEKRFYNRLMRIDKSNFTWMKSFTLGVVTHYVCDYFCYAHNIESIGIKHKAYETNLWQYYNSHLAEIEKDKSGLNDLWNKLLIKSHNNNVENDELTNETHCNMILDTVKLMNKTYMTNSNDASDKDWMNKKNQMKLDLEYATFMIEQITNLITQPERCLLVEI
jgi:hypothetical protein